MARVLIWFALIALVWWLVKPRPRVPPPAGGAPRGNAARELERMVDCARCGLHLPASDALRDAEGRDYCCAEHRAAGPR